MPHIAHTDPLFKSNIILKIQDVYELQSILFMSKYERNTLPASINNKFTHNYVENIPNFAFPKLWNKFIKKLKLNDSTGRIKVQMKNLFCRQCGI